MLPLILCRERLNRIIAILSGHPDGLSVREFVRSFSVWSWELEQAAKLGFVQIETRKPRTGRPARIVVNVSQPQAAKLPPNRSGIPKQISVRHWMFALQTVSIGPRRNRSGIGLLAKVRAYQHVFRTSRYASARASSSRLMRNPNVQACREWYFARAAQELPHNEKMPLTASGIWQRLAELGVWRAKYAPTATSRYLRLQ